MTKTPLKRQEATETKEGAVISIKREISELRGSQRNLFAPLTIFVSIQSSFREVIVEIARLARAETLQWAPPFRESEVANPVHPFNNNRKQGGISCLKLLARVPAALIARFIVPRIRRCCSSSLLIFRLSPKCFLRRCCPSLDEFSNPSQSCVRGEEVKKNIRENNRD